MNSITQTFPSDSQLRHFCGGWGGGEGEWGGKGKDLCLKVQGGAGVVTRMGHPSSPEKAEGFKPRATFLTLVEYRDASG